MMKFLTTYLLITGIGAFLALAMPSLVILGFFLLIIPGLVLSLMPTAFMWGCAFTAAYLLTRAVFGEALVAVLLAGVISGGGLYMAAQPFRLAALARYGHAQLPDIVPPSRIAMKGDIRVDVRLPKWDNKNNAGRTGLRGFACDNLCVALLFTPGVTSVTINKSMDRDGNPTLAFDPEARTYRLKPRSQCTGPGLIPSIEGRLGLFPDGNIRDGLENGEALNAEWNLRLANEVCLVVEPAITRHDILIREVSSLYGQHNRWSLDGGPPRIESIEILDGSGKMLLRDQKVEARLLTAPLFITFEGSLENPHFAWSFSIKTNKKNYDAISLLGSLDAHTNIVGRLTDAELFPKVRTALASALANPALTKDDPAFKVIGTYFNKVSKPLHPQDLALTAQLLGDPRITRYDNIYKLRELPADEMLALRRAFAAKVVRTTEPAAVAASSAGDFLANAPDGSFASLRPDEERLLDDPSRRWAYPRLVRRLADGGAARVPRILALMREHSMALTRNWADAEARRIGSYEKSEENNGHVSVIDNARQALCLLGPTASFALPQVEAMIADKTINQRSLAGNSGAEWDFMLARIGKPIESLKKPPNMSGTDLSHQRRIRDKLARFDWKRDC